MLTDLEKDAIRDHYHMIAENLPHFRPRSAQKLMIAEIAQAFSRTLTREEGSDTPVQRQGESIVVIEGPTGVGKSLAYLLAGSIMAQTRGKRLIVSSATVALQEQLIERDLPFVVEKSGLEISFALAKGRGRYLCPYRLYQLTQNHAQQSFEGMDKSILLSTRPKPQELETLRDMAKQFSERKFNGDRDTWHDKIDDNLWTKVTNDRHGCLKNDCPNRPECPFFLARDMLDSVDVVVANHDLLLSDINMGGGVILPIPEDSFYCIDEAHHLPKKALNQFAAEHTLSFSQAMLERLPNQIQEAVSVCNKTHLANKINDSSGSLLISLNQWQILLESTPELNQIKETEAVWLFQDGILPDNVRELAQNTAQTAQMLYQALDDLNEDIATVRRNKEYEAANLDKISMEIGMACDMAEQINAVWQQMLFEPKNDKDAPVAKWISRVLYNNQVDFVFHASPISSAMMLVQGLWKRAAGALLTSATLRSLGNFKLLLNQTGLNLMPKTTTVALESPFDFAQQGELYLPPLQFSPKDVNGHTEEIAQWLPKLIDDTAPVGTLVLFSSRKQMQEVALKLPDTLLPYLLIQGEMAKGKIIEQHYGAIEEGKPSIIFGLDSFAEGLDLPHEACVHVIIAKLPFAMPDNPIEKTQSRWIEKRGGNPFIEITVPEASIKLIQAVGRLIRTEQDYGRVTLLDNRVKTQRYGQQLLNCLPPFKRI